MSLLTQLSRMVVHGDKADNMRTRPHVRVVALTRIPFTEQLPARMTELHSLDDPRARPFVAAAELMSSRPDLVLAYDPEVALQAVIGASG